MDSTTMTDTPSHRSRYARTPAENTTNRSLGGLLVYAALVPLLVGLLAAPVLVGAFGLGVATAVVVSRPSARLGTAAATAAGSSSSP